MKREPRALKSLAANTFVAGVILNSAEEIYRSFGQFDSKAIQEEVTKRIDTDKSFVSDLRQPAKEQLEAILKFAQCVDKFLDGGSICWNYASKDIGIVGLNSWSIDVKTTPTTACVEGSEVKFCFEISFSGIPGAELMIELQGTLEELIKVIFEKLDGLWEYQSERLQFFLSNASDLPEVRSGNITIRSCKKRD